ncbi:MAG: 6-bladed beta-propeller [Clostridiales bacterium]|nr:6-bladed beta-propeller [Clostridiales bacterium]
MLRDVFIYSGILQKERKDMNYRGDCLGKILKISAWSLMLSFLCCGDKAPQWKGHVIEKDGLVSVSNPKEPVHKTTMIELKLDMMIEDKDGNEGYRFNRITLDSDRDGNIYVLDSMDCQTIVFDGNGSLKNKFGRRGQGPGEFQNPVSIQITAQQEIMIFDGPPKKLLYYSLDGTFLRSKSADKIPFLILSIKQRPDGCYVGTISQSPWIEEILIIDPSLETTATIARIENTPVHDKTIDIFKPNLEYAITKDGYLLFGRTDKYEVHIIDPAGKELRTISKAAEALYITQKDKDQMNEKYLRAINMGFTLIYPKCFPPMNSITTDDEGNIYVRTYKKNEDDMSSWDVFDVQGRYVTEVAFNGTSQAWKMGMLFIIDETSEGIPVIKRYRVSSNITNEAAGAFS